MKGFPTNTHGTEGSAARRSGGRGLLTLRRHVQIWVVAVVCAAATWSVWSATTVAASPHQLYLATILVVLAIAYLELTQQVEKRRRLLRAKSSTMNMISVWLLPAAMLLSPRLIVPIVILLYVHYWFRVGRPAEQPVYRAVYTASGAVLMCLSVSAVVGGLMPTTGDLPAGFTGVAVVAVAIVVFRAVNAVVIGSALLLTTPDPKPSVILGSWFGNVVEFASLILGGVTAICLDRDPWFAVLVLPAVFLLQHHALLRELIEAATTDVKTELLNASAWRQLAEQELATARRRSTNAAIFVIDMDHFKRINDAHGHLGGDVALRAVGEALADEFRGNDAVGRFGGEEFVALVPGVDAQTAIGVADRVRRRIASLQIRAEVIPQDSPLRVTASIGVAVSGEHGEQLDELLHAADRALYDAKDAGRNVSRLAATDTVARRSEAA